MANITVVIATFLSFISVQFVCFPLSIALGQGGYLILPKKISKPRQNTEMKLQGQKFLKRYLVRCDVGSDAHISQYPPLFKNNSFRAHTSTETSPQTLLSVRLTFLMLKINALIETHINPVVQFSQKGETHRRCDVWGISIFCVNLYSFVTNLFSKGVQTALCWGEEQTTKWQNYQTNESVSYLNFSFFLLVKIPRTIPTFNEIISDSKFTVYELNRL